MLINPAVLNNTSENWQAHLHLSMQLHAEKTHLVPKKRFGPLTVQRPFYPEQETCHVYLLHPPGGIVGGDELNLVVDAEANSHSLITTPGATKFYRSAGKTAIVQQSLNVSEKASLEFFPLENIYFPGAKLHSDTVIHLAKSSQFMFWESHCFGRPANNETFDSGDVTIKLSLSNENGLLLSERQRINKQELQRTCGTRDYAVLSNMIIASDHINESLIEMLRDIKLESGECGITQLDDKLLMIRILSNRTEDVFHYIQSIWMKARLQTIGHLACPPRIWHT